MDADQIPLLRLDRLVPAAACLAAFGLRLGPLWANRFHADEALYAYWASRIGSGHDPWLVGVAPDKPPLLLYLMAVAFLLLGHAEVAARLAGLLSGVVSVALVWRLGNEWESALAGPATAMPALAGAAMALSPLAIALSPTAFLDPPMLALALAAIVAAARRKPAWAGLLLGLGAAIKMQALLVLPLVIGWGILAARPSSRVWISNWVPRFCAGLAGPLLLTLAWDWMRGGVPFWIQQQANYGGVRLIWPGELWPRLMGWARYLPFLMGWPALAALIVALPLLLARGLGSAACTQAAALDLLLITFGAGYLALHWLLALPLWERYLLPLVPVGCLLLGRVPALLIPAGQEPGAKYPHPSSANGQVSLSRARGCRFAFRLSSVLRLGLPPTRARERRVRDLPLEGGRSHTPLPFREGKGRVRSQKHCHLDRQRFTSTHEEWGHRSAPHTYLPLLLATLLVLLSLPTSLAAARSALPIGGDHGPHDGLDHIAAALRPLPKGTVVYDHWLGWELRYYLWGSPPYVAYFATPDLLAEDLRVFGLSSQRYIVFPVEESTTRVERAIAAQGFELAPLLQTHDRHGQPNLSVYRIVAHGNDH